MASDGSQRWIIWNAQLLPDYEGEPGLLMVGQDITALKHAQGAPCRPSGWRPSARWSPAWPTRAATLWPAVRRVWKCWPWKSRIGPRQSTSSPHPEGPKPFAATLRRGPQLCRSAETGAGNQIGAASAWRQAWANLGDHRKGRDVTLREETDEVDLVCPIDPFRLEQVFRNILENALAACKDPVRSS